MAIATSLRWTKLRIAVLFSLASALGTLVVVNYLSEADYARCVNETNGLCARTTFVVPIIIVALAMSATGFLLGKPSSPTSNRRKA